MGDPDYIQLLVNPEENMLAIKKSISKDHLSHRVKWNARKEGTCFELYSRDLVHRLCLCNPVWQRNRSYRIYGNINAKEGLAFFRMGNCIPVNEEKE